MKEYLKNNENFKGYCNQNGLSFEKLMKMPKCYGADVVYFQAVDFNKGKLGLLDNQPAKIILTVRKEKDGLTFEPSDDILEFVSAEK